MASISLKTTMTRRPEDVLALDEERVRELAPPAEASVSYQPLPVVPSPAPAPAPQFDEAPHTDFAPQVPERPWNPNMEFDLAKAQARMGDARRQQNDLTFMSSINRAGNQIAASLGGTQRDDTVANAIDAQGKRAGEDAQTDIALDKLYAASREKAMLEDPSSPRNRRVQDALLQSIPALRADERRIRGLNQAQLEKMLGLRKDELAREETNRHNTASEQNTSNQLGELQRHQPIIEKETERHNRAMEAKQPIGLSIQSGVQGRYGTTAISNYHKDLKPIRPMIAQLENIEQMAPGLVFGKVAPNAEISEWDRIKAHLPTGLGSQLNDQQKNKLYSAVSLFGDMLKRNQTGAVISDQETPYFARILQDSLLSGPDAQAGALDMLRQAIGRQLRLSYAGYKQSATPEQWDEYSRDPETAGVVPGRHPLFMDVGVPGAKSGGAPAAGGQWQAKNPPTKPLKDGGTAVFVNGQWMRLEDGE